MKHRYLLATLVAAIFALSHLLIAYEGMTGFECFRVCLGSIANFKSDEIPQWFYYGGFGVSNIAFVALAFFAFGRKGFSRACRVLIQILSLHVISWPFVAAYGNGHFTDVKIGYYVWLLAYLLLAYMSIKYKKVVIEPKQA